MAAYIVTQHLNCDDDVDFLGIPNSLKKLVPSPCSEFRNLCACFSSGKVVVPCAHYIDICNQPTNFPTSSEKLFKRIKSCRFGPCMALFFDFDKDILLPSQVQSPTETRRFSSVSNSNLYYVKLKVERMQSEEWRVWD